PESDFLARLAGHYHDGADAVSVESRVVNLNSAISRFIQADHEVVHGENKRGNVGWTEGFSCRRDLATRAPFPEQIPVAGGEDGIFFERLIALGCRWQPDFTIVVPHRAPATYRAFWRQWFERGAAVPYIEAHVRGLSFRHIAT